MAEACFFKSFLLLFLFPHLTFSISESEALLQLKEHFTNTTSLGSWMSGSSPCNKKTPWSGLLCHNGGVIGLRLERMGLSGDIDVDALSEIKGLHFINVMNNSFQGNIPQLDRLTSLKGLFLSGNRFSGEIGSYYFAKMESLKRVWLSHNNFTGSIPLSLGQLPRLVDLRLENNRFTGHIPTFGGTNLRFIDLSNNELQGEIPASLSEFNASSFAGNPDLCGHKLGVECVKPIDTSSIRNNNNNGRSKPRKKFHKKIIALIIILVMFITTIIVAIIRLVNNKPKRSDSDVHVPENANEPIEVHVTLPHVKEVDASKRSSASSSSNPKGYTNAKATVGGGGGGGGGRLPSDETLVIVNDKKGDFGLPDLMKATTEVLGYGRLGSSYKVILANGVEVVVKKMKAMNALGKYEFDQEVKRLGKLQHLNVLTPLAYQYKKEEKIFIYEYLPNGSLLYKLHGDHDDKSHVDELHWPARLMIVQGIARGLHYLHTELSSLDVPHGNLKSSNILLGPDNYPILSDYGFGPLVNTEAVEAMLAYKTPDAMHGKVSPKTDVYCLGIVILEILTGHLPSQYLSHDEGGTNVVEWAASAFSEGRLVELLDPGITGYQNLSLGHMERLLNIGLLCTENNPEIRLGMKDVMEMIDEIQV